MKHPPLTRHESLQPLSRDHYAGLVQARHLMKAAEGNDRRRLAALTEFLDAWHRELEQHQIDEERLLLPLINEAKQTARLLDEHARLSGYVSEANRYVQAGCATEPHWVHAVGALLRDHIRWEERELFPSIQKDAPPHELAELAAQTSLIEDRRPRWRDRKRPEWIKSSRS